MLPWMQEKAGGVGMGVVPAVQHLGMEQVQFPSAVSESFGGIQEIK